MKHRKLPVSLPLPSLLHLSMRITLRWLKIKSSSDDSNKDTSDTDCDPEMLYADSTTRMESFNEKWVKSLDQEN